METTFRILVVEDLPSDVELAVREIEKTGITFTFRCVETREDFINGLNEFKPDIVLSDYALPQFDGMQALFIAKDFDPAMPFIIITGSMNEETAVACMKAGADDYIIKEHLSQLGPAVIAAKNNKQNLLAKIEAEETLRKNEKRLRTIVETSSDGIVIVNKSWIILYANHKAKNLLMLKKEKIIGSPLSPSVEPYDITECDIFQPGGNLGKAEMSVVEIEWDNEPAFLITLHDITSRKQAEEKIRRLNRVYSVLSGINKMIVRVKELDKLFNEACRIAVDVGLYNMVWIGLVDDKDKSIKPAAWKGDTAGYIEDLTIPLYKNHEILGTAGKGVKEKHYVVCNDIEHDELMKVRRPKALEKHFQSVLSFPLERYGKAIGAISFYSDKKNFFDEDEIKLLEELSMDLSLAVNSIE